MGRKRNGQVDPAWGQAICRARKEVRLTQAQLALHLGLKTRSVHRWERSYTAPSKRHQSALLAAITALNAEAAARLAAALPGGPSPAAVVRLAPAFAVAPSVGTNALQPNPVLRLAVFEMADELELSPQRLRPALQRFFARLQVAPLAVADAEAQLGAWRRETVE